MGYVAQAVAAVRVPKVEEFKLRSARLDQLGAKAFERSQVLLGGRGIDWPDKRREVEEAEYVRPLGKPLDAVPGCGKNVEQVDHARKHLQIGLPKKPVFKRIQPGEQRGVRRAGRRRGDKVALGKGVIPR